MVKNIFKASIFFANLCALKGFAPGIGHSFQIGSTLFGTSTTERHQHHDHESYKKNMLMKMTANNNNNNHNRHKINHQPTRRQIFQQSTIILPLLVTKKIANAAPPPSGVDISILDKQASKFKRVPLFAIVNGKTGTPFMILQNTGKAQAYFFTSYEGAMSVLDDARRDAAEKGNETKEMWDEARLSAVNLEFALKLSSGKSKALAQNNAKYDTVFDIIPSLQSLTEAEKIDKSGMYSERGRTPLFYSNDFEIGPEKEGGPNRTPVFLEKADLLREYSKKFPEKEDVVITVVDLMDTFTTMMGNKPIGAKVDDKIVNNFFVVPSVESRKKAVECEKERGSIPAYKIGEMIAVGGK